MFPHAKYPKCRLNWISASDGICISKQSYAVSSNSIEAARSDRRAITPYT